MPTANCLATSFKIPFTLFFSAILIVLFFSSCANSVENGPKIQPTLTQESFEARLHNYEKLLEKKSRIRDRVLFEVGILYSHPKNTRKNYLKALNCFQRIINDFPKSQYRADSQMMVFQISNVQIKDELITKLKTQVKTSQQQIRTQKEHIQNLLQQIESMKKKPIRSSHILADKILIEKQKRRLTLFSRGQIIQTYRVALGKNPVGPKVQQGDNKTPEGWYLIESKNNNSRFHLALRLSYPNPIDKKRARKLGVSPGGDIMIHGLKNGFGAIGSQHTETDWTNGCIAVTDEEIEEIVRLVPVGTPVEIRP